MPSKPNVPFACVRAAFVIMLCLMCAARSHAQFTFVDLGAVGSSLAGGNRASINNNGDAVGSVPVDAFSNPRATRLLTANTPTSVNLGVLATGTFSDATAVNLGGTAVGVGQDSVGTPLAVVYSGGTVQSLGTLGGATSAAFGINDSNVVVGRSEVTAGGDIAAFSINTNGTNRINLGGLGGGFSSAQGISNSGVVVGFAVDGGGIARAFRAQAGTASSVTSLLAGVTVGGTVITGESLAFGIRDNRIVGQYRLSALADQRAFIYTLNATTATDLGSLIGVNDLSARGVNSSGFAVGFGVGASGNVAFVYDAVNGIRDLNTVVGTAKPADFLLTEAYSINDFGGIVGIGVQGGIEKTFYIAPTNVPEPTTGGLLLVGGITVLFLSVRRRYNRL